MISVKWYCEMIVILCGQECCCHLLDKVVELLRNVDYIGDLGSANRRNKPRFGQGCFLIRHNKNLQIRINGYIIKLKLMISDL